MKKTDIDLDNPELLQVLDLIENTSASVFMTGKAGTGKSTFLRHITSVTRKKHVVLAPTGIAAVNVGGQTLHSFFHIPLKPLLPDDPEFSPKRLSRRMKYNRPFVKLLRELELIVIDEISMVRADIIDFIDKILRHYSGRPFEPFGGKQLLMVGDIFQLEPVVTADAREILRRVYPNFYFFSARAFSDAGLVPVELRKVYRQTDSGFIGLLDRVRDGQPSVADLALINSRVGAPADTSGDILSMTIATRREIVDYINRGHLDALSTPPVSFEALVLDDFPEQSFPTDRVLELKEGAQVVFIRNDPERRWVNGTLGRVTYLTSDTLRVTLESGDEHTIEPEVWNNVVFSYDEKESTVREEIKGSFRQFPVKLAWALTIHKSQGLTFSRLTIDVGRGAFTSGQSYVALSRATSLEGITLASPLRPSDIYVNPDVRRFAHTFNDSALLARAREEASARRLYAEAARQFDLRHFGSAYDALRDALAINPGALADRRTRLIALRKLHDLDRARLEVNRLERLLAERDEKLARIADEFVQLGHTSLEEAWETQASVANFEKALDLCPGHYEATIGLGRAAAMSGDIDRAVQLLAGAADADTTRAEAPYRLGALFLSQGDVANAFNYLRRAKKADPARPEIYDTLADAAEIAGDDTQAARYRRQAARLRKPRKKP